MQVKKFEAPTIQEALDTIKRELGPEAIILQTKKNRRGFGLMSKPSVEITAAVSERSLNKKKFVETRNSEPNREQIKKLPASRQAEMFEKYAERQRERAHSAQQHVQMSEAVNAGNVKVTATRYIDISDDQKDIKKQQVALNPEKAVTPAIANRMTALGNAKMSMEEELQHLKRMLNEMKNSQDEGALGSGAQVLMNQASLATPALQDAFEQLVISGVDKRFALTLAKRVSQNLGKQNAEDPDSVADFIAAELMQSTEVLSPLNGIEPAREGQGPAIIALVGPTGVGKTTTVAKMASEALLKRNLKVGLINLDNYKVAAFDQLGTYAKIMNVPFRSAGNVDDLKAALQDFKGLDLVLIDTTGRSQRDPNSLKEMHVALSAVPNVRSQLVLSVTTRDTELYDMANRFSLFHPEGLILSKLDEANIYGSIYNVSQKVKLPLLYFTTGQRVPEDIEEATRERVAALILNI